VIAVVGMVLITSLSALQIVALVRPRGEWTISNVYGGDPEATDGSSCLHSSLPRRTGTAPCSSTSGTTISTSGNTRCLLDRHLGDVAGIRRHRRRLLLLPPSRLTRERTDRRNRCARVGVRAIGPLAPSLDGPSIGAQDHARRQTTTLWIVVMFSMLFADVLTLYIPEYAHEVVSGATSH
jgi:hypothetical protein